MNKKLSKNVTIFVDLDGTLIKTDVLLEQVLLFLKKNPFNLFLIFRWVFISIANLKYKLSKIVNIKIENLPYNFELITWLKIQKKIGNTIILCTATNIISAKKINDHLKLFDKVIGSDKNINLKGHKKLKEIIKLVGKSEFCYVGNSKPDIEVWKEAKYAVVVNADKKIINKANFFSEIIYQINKTKFSFSLLCKMLRVHQWTKNLLLIVPFFTSHQSISSNTIFEIILSIIAFSFCASAVYIMNDLLDIENDRDHRNKKLRPFAAGNIHIFQGAIFFILCLIISFSLAYLISYNFLICLLIYFIITCLYSFHLKSLVLIDCIILSSLYTIRIIAGSTSINVDISFWLIAVSVFTFLSLAFLKRYVELSNSSDNQQTISGRGYKKHDAPLIQMLGIASGFSSILVLAFYINGETSKYYYSSPEYIWLSVALMLFWICWVWLKAHRKEMDEDPIIFATKDKISLTTGLIFISLFILAKTVP